MKGDINQSVKGFFEVVNEHLRHPVTGNSDQHVQQLNQYSDSTPTNKELKSAKKNFDPIDENYATNKDGNFH